MKAVAAAPNAVKVEKPKVEDLHAAQRETEQTIQGIRERVERNGAKLAAFRAERRTLILQARVAGDQLAQKSMHAVDEHTAALEKDIADDKDALDDLGAELTSQRNAIALTEWEDERAELRKLLVARLGGDAFEILEKAAAAFASALRAANEEDARIAAALVSFAPELRGARDGLQLLKRYRSEILGFRFREVLPIETRGMTAARAEGRSSAQRERQAYASALESLNRLELVF